MLHINIYVNRRLLSIKFRHAAYGHRKYSIVIIKYHERKQPLLLSINLLTFIKIRF